MTAKEMRNIGMLQIGKARSESMEMPSVQRRPPMTNIRREEEWIVENEMPSTRPRKAVKKRSGVTMMMSFPMTKRLEMMPGRIVSRVKSPANERSMSRIASTRSAYSTCVYPLCWNFLRGFFIIRISDQREE